ncbi:hypothetical protein, partial [Erythrobacter sp. YJ-T3-07]|uniref:hypothetical protein n=1 Tax=Erythrobacter sp. YJ-T3-07 TaxID=2793063 RepID=UPI001F3EA14C
IASTVKLSGGLNLKFIKSRINKRALIRRLLFFKLKVKKKNLSAVILLRGINSRVIFDNICF